MTRIEKGGSQRTNFTSAGFAPFLYGMRTLHQETMFLMMELLKEENMIMPQYFILRYIGVHGPQHLSSIANFLRVSNPTVTGLMDTLESQGLVTRQRDQDDRRGTLIALTDRSMELFSRMEQYQSRLMDDILNGFDIDKLNELGSILADLAVKMRKIVEQNVNLKGKEYK